MVKIALGGNHAAAMQESDGGEDMRSLDRRLKLIEERYTNLRAKSQVAEQNMLSKNKTTFTEIRSLTIELTEVKKELQDVKDKIIHMISEMQSLAKKEQVDVLRKYVDLWSPLNFVTRNDVEEIVKGLMQKKENV